MAHKFFLSPSYSAVFSRMKPEEFLEYVTMVRMRKAEQFLSRPEDSIAGIAEKVGYHDVKYFARVFKKHKGVTPGEYRRLTCSPAGAAGRTDDEYGL